MNNVVHLPIPRKPHAVRIDAVARRLATFKRHLSERTELYQDIDDAMESGSVEAMMAARDRLRAAMKEPKL